MQRDDIMNVLTVNIEREASPHSRRRFVAMAALVFLAGVIVTCAIHTSMSSMSELPMPGGWMLSPTFTPMCGRTWLRTATAFVGMWIAMMTAMMLPSFAPLLWRYRAMLDGAGTRLSWSMAAGYAFIWTMTGIAAFALVAILTEFVMRAPAIARCVPFASGAVVSLAGVAQCSQWHATLLARCTHCRHMRVEWLDGVRHGLHCVSCCAGLTAALFVFGVMDLRAMALVTLAITAERLLPSFRRVPQVIGIVLVLLGLMIIAGSSRL
jgi:predicted metal-binding membrane protein